MWTCIMLNFLLVSATNSSDYHASELIIPKSFKRIFKHHELIQSLYPTIQYTITQAWNSYKENEVIKFLRKGGVIHLECPLDNKLKIGIDWVALKIPISRKTSFMINPKEKGIEQVSRLQNACCWYSKKEKWNEIRWETSGK